MKIMMKFNDFLLEKKIPVLTYGIKTLLSILDGNKIDIFRTFKINKDVVNVDSEIERLYTDSNFKKELQQNNLKIGKPQNTEDSETLLNNNIIVKFFFIYEKDSIELEEPLYIILQHFNTKTNKRSNIIGFSNKDSIIAFYKKLTDSTIELTNSNDTFIYQTTNGGNNWEMKNVQMEDDDMKSSLDNNELQKLINTNNLKIKN